MSHAVINFGLFIPIRTILLFTLLSVASVQAQVSSGGTPAAAETAVTGLDDPAPLDVVILADTLTRNRSTVTYEGYVDVKMRGLRLQADRLVYNEATDEVTAIGNVILDYEGQRVTGRRAHIELRTGNGTIWDSAGFTDRTPDGTTLYFEAQRVDRTKPGQYIITDGRVTSCEGVVPKWSFTSQRVNLRLGDRVSLKNPVFRVKDVPLLWLPYAAVPINKQDRSSGFLLPGFSNSNIKGYTVNVPYYQTLGRSADITPHFDIYRDRGVGFGADFRARPGERSHVNTGFFTVKDRLFGEAGEDQGGTAFYATAVQYLPHGFTAVADVNITSSLIFRQIFSDSFQQAISPEERTQIYVTNNFGAYSFGGLIQKRQLLLPETSVAIRHLPSFHFDRRPEQLGKRFPIYFSFGTSVEGLNRKEDRFRTSPVVGRIDLNPHLTVPLPSISGWAITPSVGLRSTFYSQSADPLDRTHILGDGLSRQYFELSLDIRPPSLMRVFQHQDGSRWFKHVIEPYVTYRLITGIGDDIDRIIRFDEVDAIADTSEIEYGLVNRFFVTRPGEAGHSPVAHELLTIKIAQKYFFEPDFGGALKPDQRNQFYPLNTLSGFSFGGTLRRFSPLHIDARLRPTSSLFADVRLDYDTREKSVRDVSLRGGISKKTFSIAQAWYFTRQVRRQSGELEAGTFSGNIYQTSFTIGNRNKGPFGGFDLTYDFQNRFRGRSRGRLLSSTFSFGYTSDCCSIQFQNTIYRVGLRNENRFAVSLTLNGIGSFGKHTRGGQQVFNQ